MTMSTRALCVIPAAAFTTRAPNKTGNHHPSATDRAWARTLDSLNGLGVGLPSGQLPDLGHVCIVLAALCVQPPACRMPMQACKHASRSAMSQEHVASVCNWGLGDGVPSSQIAKRCCFQD